MKRFGSRLPVFPIRNPKGATSLVTFLPMFVVILTSGCTATARLYPVQGPLSARTPPPAIAVKFTGGVNSGNVSLVSPDGEAASGHWARVATHSTGPTGIAPASAPRADGMPALWDTIYGSGFFTAHVLGAGLYATAVISGKQGTVYNLEFYSADTNRKSVQIRGVAKDSAGNLYKVVFNAIDNP
jgi:hypothetical protein